MARGGRTLHPVGRRADSRRRLLISRSAQGELDPRAGRPGPPVTSDVSEATAGLTAIEQLIRGATPATWVFTGDSITHGALYTEGWRSFPELFAERVRWELRRFHDVVINTGVCGERAGGLLDQLEPRVLRFRPDVVLLLIGMNDALAGPPGRGDFRAQLYELAGRIREAGAVLVLQTPNAVYAANCQSRCDLPGYVDIVREVADQAQVPLIDHWRHWEQRKPGAEALLGWLQDESLHPNYLGHRAMARLVCQTFGVFDPSSLTCSLPLA